MELTTFTGIAITAIILGAALLGGVVILVYFGPRLFSRQRSSLATSPSPTARSRPPPSASPARWPSLW
ncbi:MAG: hypothetical protein HYZ49_00925 [Chloroflexi bacterium]|nr:hypothetical protein [Chloroflexota bacterium]